MMWLRASSLWPEWARGLELEMRWGGYMIPYFTLPYQIGGDHSLWDGEWVG